MSTRMRTYVLFVILAAALGATAVASHYPVLDWSRLGLLCLLAVVVGNMAFEMPLAASVSLGFAMTFAAVVYFGPLGGGLVGLMGAISVDEIRQRKSPLLMIGNGAQLAVSAIGAGLIYILSDGVPLQTGARAGALYAPALATAAFFVVNVTLVGMGVAIKNQMTFRDALRLLDPASYSVSLVVLALLGLVMAHLLVVGSWAGLLLLVLPFALARRTFRVYLELSEAYTTTVRSLVAAIEAKDPYTRGHSERVALLSRALAERIGLPASDAELVERAALLHDVGKIGVSIATLTSPSPLTADEYREIRNHPAIGSSLLESVEFLSDTVPIVRHHHEHMDGAGYPDGLSGDEIPYLSRMLATVDAYDAMTSDRAYRPAMSDTEAIAEMIRVAGQQLDPSMVNALAALLLERQRSGVQSA